MTTSASGDCVGSPPVCRGRQGAGDGLAHAAAEGRHGQPRGGERVVEVGDRGARLDMEEPVGGSSLGGEPLGVQRVARHVGQAAVEASETDHPVRRPCDVLEGPTATDDMEHVA